MMTPLRVLVTRPVQEAGRWVTGLHAAGLDALALPLIAIEPAGDEAREALRAHWKAIASYRAVMFVSAAAVNCFFAEKPSLGEPGLPTDEASEGLPADLRWWATGPGTVAALRRCGVPAALVDTPAAVVGRFDSEALWAQVQGQAGSADRVLIVRGGDAHDQPTGRSWLARQVEATGAVCEQVVAYRRQVPAFTAQDRCLAEASATDGAVWLFSSSEAIGNLLQWLPATSWAQARAVATHSRIAQAAHEAGFGQVRASQPLLEALTASIESLR